MQKISLFILFCCLSIASSATNKYAVSSATAPSGTTSYCLGAVASSTYSDAWVGCGGITGSGGTITYQWQINNGSATTNITGATGTFTMTSTSPGTVNLAADQLDSHLTAAGNYTLTVKYSWGPVTAPSGCSLASAVISSGLVISVYNTPTVTITPGTYTKCTPAGVLLSATASTGVTYLWATDDGTLSYPLTASTVTATPTASENYVVTVTDAHECTNSATSSITVLPLYIAPVSSPSVICSSGTATLSAIAETGAYTSDAVTGISYTVVPTGSATQILNTYYEDPLDYDNDGYASVPIGFTFYFYGIGYSTANISANGFVNFGDPGNCGDAYSTPLPDPYAPGDGVPASLIALFLHDLDPDLEPPTGDAAITYTTTGTAPNRQFIVTYTNVMDADGSEVNNGQIVLYESSNNIDLLIGSCSEATNPVNVGIQNADGSAAVYPSGRNSATFTVAPGGEAWHFGVTAPSDGSVTYTWSPGGITIPTTIVTPTATTNYTFTATTGGCTQSAVTTVSVTPQPAVTVAPTSASICTTGSITLITVETGGIGTATYTWSGPGITTSTTSVTSLAVTPTVTGSYSVVVSFSVTGCVSNPATSLITVAAQPTVTAVTPSVSSICSGGSLTLVATVAGGAGAPVYTWSGFGIATTTTSVPSLAISPSVVGTGNYTVTVAYNGSGCSISAAAVSSNVTVTTYISQQWIGGASGAVTDWNTAINWGCGTVPVATDNVIIPSSAFYMPTLASSGIGYASNLNVQSGTTITLSSTAQLYINGSLTNNNVINGPGTLYLNGTTTQTITGTGKISNITLNNSAGAVIGSSGSGDMLNLTGVMLISNGALTTNDHLTLISVAGSGSVIATGSIGNITSSSNPPISGNVTAQQYIPAAGSAANPHWRFLSHPFNSTMNLSQLCGDLDITNGWGVSYCPFVSSSLAASSFWYYQPHGNSNEGYDPGWTAFTDANSASCYTCTTVYDNNFYQYEGIRIYVWGTEGQYVGNGVPTYTYSPTTLSMAGNVNWGTQYEAMAVGTYTTQNYNLLGNPYPSPVDLGAVLNTANTANQLYAPYFYVWSAPMGTFETYALSVTPTYILEANGNFEVRANVDGNTLTFYENQKTSTVTQELLRTAAPQYVSLSLYEASGRKRDVLKILFSDGATSEESREDAGKAPSPSDLELYSWSGSHTKLAIDARPYEPGKAISLGLTIQTPQQLSVKVDELVVPAGGQVYLHDKLLQQYIPLQQGTQYNFLMDSSASQTDSRFELSMGAVNADMYNLVGMQLLPNPATDEITISYNAMEKALTAVHIDNIVGETVIAQDLGQQQNGSVVIAVGKLPPGVYMVTLTSGNNKVVKRLVKE